MITQLYDTAPCGFFAFGDDGILVGVNTTCAALLGYPKGDIEHKPVENLCTLPTRIFFQTHFFPLVRIQGRADEIFITLLHRNGDHLPVLLNAQRVDGEGFPITCCAFIVVSNRKVFEDELVRARNDAEKALAENSELLRAKNDLQRQAEDLEKQMQLVSRQHSELQQFSHVVTHNLTEPLRKITLFTGKLSTNPEPALLEKLSRSAAQMKMVVSGLQQYVWLNEKPNHFGKVELGAVIEKAVAHTQMEEGFGTLSLSNGALPSVEGDDEQLQLLFYHLLSNAVKFKKGLAAEVTIQATVLKRNSFQTVDAKYKYEDYVRLQVTDRGTGFDPQYKEHVFELFRRLGYAEGQGLGLALCRKIAANHLGSIEADTVLGSHTTITVWLPLAQAAM